MEDSRLSGLIGFDAVCGGVTLPSSPPIKAADVRLSGVLCRFIISNILPINIVDSRLSGVKSLTASVGGGDAIVGVFICTGTGSELILGEGTGTGIGTISADVVLLSEADNAFTSVFGFNA